MSYLRIGAWIAGGLAVLGVLWALYAGIIRPVIKPNPSTTQNAEQIVNHNFQTPKVYFGCINFRLPKEEVTKK